MLKPTNRLLKPAKARVTRLNPVIVMNRIATSQGAQTLLVKRLKVVMRLMMPKKPT